MILSQYDMTDLKSLLVRMLPPPHSRELITLIVVHVSLCIYFLGIFFGVHGEGAVVLHFCLSPSQKSENPNAPQARVRTHAGCPLTVTWSEEGPQK